MYQRWFALFAKTCHFVACSVTTIEYISSRRFAPSALLNSSYEVIQ